MYYSNGKAAVAGYSEEYSSGQDDSFAEDAGAEAARRHNKQEAYWAICEYIEEVRGDIKIAVHLGNLTIAGNLRAALAQAEKDLEALK